jgi:ABC-2 type transport system ATP-binding protein
MAEAPTTLEAPPQPAGSEDPDDARPAIRTESLAKTYRDRKGGDVRALLGLDLRVPRGEFFGLLGPNGAGKSTAIGMITTTVVPTGGRAWVAGYDVARAPAEVKRRIGVVPQHSSLDRSLTTWENLYYHGRFFGLRPKVARRRSTELLDTFGLADRADTKPWMLSGGLAQRMMVARALMHEPEILILDEPTSGIDPQTRANLWDRLGDLHRNGTTILLTTHYLDEADALCERIAIVDHGELLAEGTPAELKYGIGADTVVCVTVDGDAAPLVAALGSTFAPALDGTSAPAADGGGKPRVEQDGATVRTFTDAPDGVLARLIEAAGASGLTVLDANTQPPSLQTVFLTLTGREYRE